MQGSSVEGDQGASSRAGAWSQPGIGVLAEVEETASLSMPSSERQRSLLMTSQTSTTVQTGSQAVVIEQKSTASSTAARGHQT